MAHKVHPKSYRIKELADWSSRWLDTKKFSQYLEEDFKMRSFLEKRIGQVGVEKIEIERFPGKVNVIIYSSRPGLIIGRGGGGVEDLKKEIERNVFKKSAATNLKKENLKIEIREVKDPWISASLSSQWVAQQLEKRLPFRRVLKQTVEKIASTKGVLGARVEVAGRLDGSEIARREWLKKGRLPLQSLRADIDYAQAKAHCSYGIVGVKIWIYKGEKF